MRRGKGTVTRRRANWSNCIVHWEWELTKVNGEEASQLALVCRMSFLGTNFINNNDCQSFGQQQATFHPEEGQSSWWPKWWQPLLFMKLVPMQRKLIRHIRERVGEKCIAVEREVSQEEREVRSVRTQIVLPTGPAPSVAYSTLPTCAMTHSATAAKDGDHTRCGMQSSSVTAVCALDRPSHSVVHLTQSHSTMEDR